MSRRGGVAVLTMATALAAPVSSVIAQSHQPAGFSLSLPELAGRPFAGGGLIELPEGTRISRLELTLSARLSRRVDEGSVLARLDERPIPVTVVTIDDTKVARYQVPDPIRPLVVRKGTDLRIQGSVKDRDDLTQEWILRAGTTPFIVEKAGDRDGERLNLVIKAPADRPILFEGTAQLTVAVHGEVFPARDLGRLSVGGVPLRTDRTQTRLAFAASTIADSSTREIVIEASDDFGRSAAVVIPVVKTGQAGTPRR